MVRTAFIGLSNQEMITKLAFYAKRKNMVGKAIMDDCTVRTVLQQLDELPSQTILKSVF